MLETSEFVSGTRFEHSFMIISYLFFFFVIDAFVGGWRNCSPFFIQLERHTSLFILLFSYFFLLLILFRISLCRMLDIQDIPIKIADERTLWSTQYQSIWRIYDKLLFMDPFVVYTVPRTGELIFSRQN